MLFPNVFSTHFYNMRAAHTRYTLLESRDIPRYLACRVITCRPVMEVLVLGTKPLPRPLTELATRDELTTWLTRVLFNTFIPGKSKPNPNNVRLPHNLVAFFGLLMYLHRAGYPGHWLAEFLTRVLSGRMVSDIAPYTGWYPIPVSERTRRVPSRAVRTDPWLVEFEMILATAYYALPFPVLLPADFSHDLDDMVVYEARVTPVQQFTTLPRLNENPYEPRTHLLFFRADLVSAAGAIRNLPSLFEGSASPAPGTLFIMTAQEHVQYQECIRFRLSRRRVERMKKESARWSMVAFRSGTGVLGERRRAFIVRTLVLRGVDSQRRNPLPLGSGCSRLMRPRRLSTNRSSRSSTEYPLYLKWAQHFRSAPRHSFHLYY